jgi:hypothetical protein
MDEITHIPKKIVVNGKEKIVYARTPETEQELDHYRMEFFASVVSLPLTSFGDKLKEKQLIILAHYNTANRVVRSRLELDKRPHKVFSGTTLIQYYFDNDNYRDGFPVFKQFYLQFGYTDSHNKKLHELIVETLFTRYRAENHFWLIIPKTLEAMAAQWGDALMNLQMFPILDLLGEEEGETAGPVSVVTPMTTDDVGRPANGRIGEFEAPSPILGDPEEARRRKRDDEKLRWKSYE